MVQHIRLAVIATHPIQYQVPLFKALQNRGVEVTVFYGDDSSVRGKIDQGFGVNVAWDISLLDGYSPVFLNNIAHRKKGYFRINCPEIYSRLGRGGFSAVLVTAYGTWYQVQGVRAAYANNIPILYRGEVLDNPLPPRPLHAKIARFAMHRWLYPRCSAILTIGKHAEEHFLMNNVPPEKLFPAPYCVDNCFFLRYFNEFAPQRAAIRRGFEVSDDAMLIVFSGKLIPRKNPGLILDALSLIKDRKRYAVLYIGEGELRDALQRKAGAIGVHAVMTGFKNQTELWKYYVAGDAMVLPSWREEWGLVVNEAMNFGLPVVVSDRVGSHHDLVIDNRTGFVIEAGNSQQLAEKLSTLAGNDDLRRRMGKHARELVAQYDIGQAAEGILKSIEYAVRERPR